MIFIGEASRLSGASVKAIRHYEKLGLLPNLGRSGVYRTFTQADIATIGLIKQAQQAGFVLAEFKDAFLSHTSAPSWPHIEKLISHKEAQIEQDIHELKKRQGLLRQYSKSILDCLAENPACSEPLINSRN